MASRRHSHRLVWLQARDTQVNLLKLMKKQEEQRKVLHSTSQKLVRLALDGWRRVVIEVRRELPLLLLHPLRHRGAPRAPVTSVTSVTSSRCAASSRYFCYIRYIIEVRRERARAKARRGT
jgi:hypothetical protein